MPCLWQRRQSKFKIMRLSDWRIIWNPGLGQKVLLDYDQDMDQEISLNGQWLAPVMKSDFALRVVTIIRGNHRARLDFGGRVEKQTGAASWLGALVALQAAPYGIKGVLSVQRRGGRAQSFAAVLLNSTHSPSLLDGIIETRSQYSFRIQKI